MVRATPTGVSAVIDAYGRILPGKLLSQGAYGVIDVALPPALCPRPCSISWATRPFVLLAAVAVAAVAMPVKTATRDFASQSRSWPVSIQRRS